MRLFLAVWMALILVAAALVVGVARVDSQPATTPPPETGPESEPSRYGVPPAYDGTLPTLSALNLRSATLDRVVTGLDEPWAFEFLSENEVLVTERKGRLLRIRLDGSESPIEITGLPPIANDRQQTGLFDVALHPDFDRNRRVYFSYASADPETGRYYLTAVARAILADDRLEALEPVIEAGPYGWSPSNFGGALAFLADRSLLVSVGDRSEQMLAQRGDRLQGKILRVTDSGAVPPDNPFVDDPAVDDRIWALGLRNVQGLVRDPVTDRVYATSHGPLGGDEVNRIRPGRNYGWPTITYGRNYSTARIGIGTHAEGFEQPLFYYLPSEAISPLAVYRGDLFGDWDGDLLVGALKGRHVSRLDLDGDVVRSEYPILSEIDDRIRDLRVGPDGAVWVLGQTTGLWRLGLDPEPPVPAQPADGEGVYRMACAGCHDAGAGGAARLDEGCRWQRLAEKGRETLLANTVRGIGNMPERGLCELCEDRHLAAAVDYMLEAASDCPDP
ncbi:PQQ-dependent sugar dehydrogenase [Wenzhouxiangella sp. XN79A]|uniref:PQQ-dependent sugar dehydrogenase n=1 Tax=Wenzhouxiangella sp. XN79A TaxID=2724193 RepID=UPI00144AC79F|nr:PQQ-dependent sugar dehydrogenase [Wenzhouxiangella sp. XN79A]NKI35720.1 PQQ-dependent sugar dehydrogenase [Wenzhouxiangella sp. XN79A]